MGSSFFILVMLIYLLYSACFIGTMGSFTAKEVATAAVVSELRNLTSDSLFSNSTITEMKIFTELDLQIPFQMYNIFMVMWTVSLINAISFTTMSGAFCRWYWARGDEKYKET